MVVHESDLPAEKCRSSLTWQSLEGKNSIPITLFETAEQVDSRSIYAQRWIEFKGHELVGELSEGEANWTQEPCRGFVENYLKSISCAREQQDQETFYACRTPRDSELDLNKTLNEQFNFLCIVDYDRYLTIFELNGKRFNLTISKDESL